ncbi:MAG TPA: outer membrane protein transport protein [Thermoanaerobaculia bacterium]|nr:outer membrane protein transport protein [Thermoanaerobaculia bacterium]
MRKYLIALVAVLALPAAAQNVDIEALSGLQFNFGNPGARSLGMGGAFLGLADDASAAEANPAGLTILRKPEVSIEVRNYLEQQLFTTTGTFPEMVRTPFTYHSDRAVITFASAVFPIKNFTLGAYFHEPLNNQGGGIVDITEDPITGDVLGRPNFFMPTEVVGDEIQYVGTPISEQECENRREQMNNPFACLEFRLDPFVSVLQLRQRTFGLAGGWQVHPKFSVGGSVRHQRFQEVAGTLRLDPNTGQLKQLLYQSTADIENGNLEIKEETDITFSVGFKWAPTDKISVGGVYKKGPEFAAPLLYADASNDFELQVAADVKFHVPDVAGIGVSVRPIPTLTINFDAVHVKYSNLVDDFVAASAEVSGIDEPFKANDVVELRLGAEYLFSTRIPFAIRGGYWRDPAHSVQWNGPLNHPTFVAEQILYPEGEDQNHFSIGAGLAWPRFQIDVAYDTSDQYKVGSISAVTRF